MDNKLSAVQKQMLQNDDEELIDDNSPSVPMSGASSNIKDTQISNKVMKPFFTGPYQCDDEDFTKDPIPTEVVKGRPSEIKLVVQDKSKPIIMTTIKKQQSSPVSEEKTNNPPPVTGTGAQKQIQVRLPIKTRPTIENVNEKMETTTPRHLRHIPFMPTYPKGRMYPKGIPKSFLLAQNNAAASTSESQPHNTASNHYGLSKWGGPPELNSQYLTKERSIPNSTPMPLEYSYNENVPGFDPMQPVYIQTENIPDNQTSQVYSPSDIYADSFSQDAAQNLEADEIAARSVREGELAARNGGVAAPRDKRVSAFHRLGPVAPPKKPKLTINLSVNKDESVREVLEEQQNKEKYTPAHLRPEVLDSTDDLVVKYLPFWPWKKNNIIAKTVTVRSSKSVMILEQEQMEPKYKEDIFFKVSITGIPSSWSKENALDAVLTNIGGFIMIPCFIELTEKECKFLVIKSRSSLLMIHKMGFVIHHDNVNVTLSISQTSFTLNHIDFLPVIILRKLLARNYDNEKSLSLKAFTIKEDLSHFIYFPLHLKANQKEITQMSSVIAWNYLVELDLSHNRIYDLSGFDLLKSTPKLKHLDLSCNALDRMSVLFPCRGLPLNSLRLEGNPLCLDYIDPDHYVKVARMIFPELRTLDDEKIHIKGEFPMFKKQYCPEPAQHIVNKFLDIFFPLLELPPENRMKIHDLYDVDAILSISYRDKLRVDPKFRYCRNLFCRSRNLLDGYAEGIEGDINIAKYISKWPPMQHDPFTLTVDVLNHNEFATVVRFGGVLKLTSDSLADDEHLLAFTRTLLLRTQNGVEYKIQNEMLTWELPSIACAKNAFRITKVKSQPVNFKLETPPDDELKKNLVNIFMKITNMEKKVCERCLESKEWNFPKALEYFTKLLRLDGLDMLNT